MILYTGGKYQGKLNSALDKSQYSVEDVFDFELVNKKEYAHESYAEKKVWYHLEDYIRSLALSYVDSDQLEKMVKKLIEDCSPEVIIIAETGAGVIPIDEYERTYREVCGKISIWIAQKADEVYRVLCGIKVKIK